MRAVEITTDRTLRTVDLEETPLGDRDVRIATSYAGICGSDLHNLVMPHIAPAGTVLGHEFSGRIVETGSAIRDLAVGDRVTVLPFEYCGQCRPCRAGHPQVCMRRAETKLGGAFRRGAFAESVVSPASSAYRLPDEVTDEHAALVEPLAVGVHGVAMSGVHSDAPVTVIGGGPIGVAVTLALKARGFTSIVGVEPNAWRREKLSSFGIATTTPEDARDTVPRLLDAPSPLAVFDCTGHPTGPPLALSLLEPMGRLVFLGSTVEPAPLDVFEIVRNEIELRGAVMYTPGEFGEAIDHLAAGTIPADDLITDVRGLDAAQATFEELMSGESRQLKVLLAP